MATKRARILGLSALAVAGAGVAWWFALAPSPRHAAPPDAAVARYLEMVSAGERLAPLFSRPADLKPGELEGVVHTNAAVLREIRQLLTKDCRPPMRYTAADEAIQSRRLGVLKHIAQNLALEGRLAEKEGCPGDACAAYLDAMRLGHLVSRAGPVIDALVGLSCEGIGAQPLGGLLPQLSAADCRFAAAQLQVFEVTALGPDAMLAHERAWRRRVLGLRGQVAVLFTWRSLRQTEAGAAAKLQSRRRDTRRLLLDLAARAYAGEHGRPPEQPAQLVPDYLRQVPLDPVTGVPLAFLSDSSRPTQTHAP